MTELNKTVARAQMLWEELQGLEGIRIDLIVPGGYRGSKERKRLTETEMELIVLPERAND